MGKSIKVKKGNEILEIQDTDLKAAVSDGYLPTERVIVANSKTKETFEIDPQDLPSAFNDGFSFQDISKKKASTALSMAGAKATPSGGQVGSSNPQSEKDKVLEYLKIGKPAVTVTAPSVKEAESVSAVLKNKGIPESKGAVVESKIKKDESPFDISTNDEFLRASDKLNEVMYGEGDDWVDPVKAHLKNSKNATNLQDALDNIKAIEVVGMNLAPSGYYADKVLKNSIWSQASGDNLTANMLRQKADDYQKRTAAFQGIQKSESDTGSGNANKEFYNYVYGQQIDNAAIKSYAEKNPNFKDQLQAAGIDLNDPQLSDRIGSAKAGQIISESIFDPEVIEYAKNEAPWLLPALKSKASTLITDYKDFGINLVANKVSRAIQESGYNNIDPIFNFANDNIKEFARSTAKLELTPEEYAVYEKNILGNEEKYLDTPSFFEGFASAGKSMLSGAKSTLTTPFKSIPETIREGWEKEATNVSADPKGLMKVIRDSGHAVGIVSSLAAMGNVLGGGGTGFYSTKVVPALSGAIPFMGDFIEEGTMKYPNNPVKAWTSALFNTAMYSALSYKIFPVKDVQNAFKNIKPEVAEIVENLASGRITREVARQQMSTVAKKGFDLLTGSVAKSAKISAELTGITALNSMLDKVMGMSGDTFEKYHPEGEEADAFTSLFLSNLVVGGMAKFGEMKRGNRIVEQSLYAAASNPKRFQDIIDKMEVKDPTINKQEMLDNLTYLTQVKDGLDKMGIDPKNQARYLFEAMKEKVQADAIKSTPDANITRMGESKINESRKIKDRILEGEDVVGEEQAEVEKEVSKESETTEQVLNKAVEDGYIEGTYADMVKAGQGEQVLKEISQQAQNITADGEPHNKEFADIARKSAEQQVGKKIVALAIEKYPIESFKKGEPEQISQPIELSPELPEGYVLPEQEGATNKPNIIRYEDAIKTKHSVSLENLPEGIDEQSREARSQIIRKRENIPPKFKEHPIGTYAVDKYGEAYQLQNIPIDELITKNEGTQKQETVDKYAEWEKKTGKILPVSGVENYAVHKGKVVITDGQHRVLAAKKNGLKEIPVWVALTNPNNHARPLLEKDIQSHFEKSQQQNGKEVSLSDESKKIPPGEKSTKSEGIGIVNSEYESPEDSERVTNIVHEKPMFTETSTSRKREQEIDLGGGLNNNTNDASSILPIEEIDKLRGQKQTDLATGNAIELENKMAKEGIQESLVITYYPNEGKAILTDGHTRLDVAKDMGAEKLPIRIVEKFSDAPNNAKDWTPPKDLLKQQQKTTENAVPIRSTEKVPLGETPGDSAKVGEGVSQPKEPAGTRTQEEGKIEGEEGLAEPPKTPPPTEKVVIPESSKNSERDKGILNRLYKAKNTPKEAKEGFEKEGLKYEPKSQEEAFGIAKSIIDEYGIDEAVSIAQSMKFDGDVNSLIIGESLNRLYDKIEEAKTNSEKLELAKQYEDLSILYDKLGRYGGRFNSAVHFFYKKSPLGIILLENTKRREDFAKWAKQKEKSWREVYEEIKDIPEFAEVFNEKVNEKVKSERVEARKAKREKVHKAIDDTMAKWAKKFSADLPEGTKKAGVSIDVFKAAATTMKKAYDAGEAIGKVIQDAIDYITKETGINDWDKEGFRAEWAEKLTEGKGKKVFTDEESKSKYIEKLKKKLTGLSEKQKEDVIRKAFAKAIEKDALKYDDLREIIQNVVGRGELTSEEQAKLTELVKKTNAVEEAAKKVREERTEESLRRFRLAEIEAGKATRELNEILWNKPDILKRLTSIMQLNTLGIPALVNNPIYNIWNQATLRFPVGIINDLIDRGMALAAKVAGKQYERDYNVWETQKEFFKKLGFGSKESLQQLMTGLNRMDYIQKEVYGQQIRPGRAIRDLFAYATGKKSLSKSQIIDKSLQATVGIPAEAVARVLNIGDKPQRFAAEGSQAAAFAKELGLKDMDYRLFIEFPREEAYRIYKEQGLSDAEAGKKADYVRDVILKEGQRSTFQQDNILNNVINAAFGQLGGKDSGTAALAKSLTVSPFIKIPSNAFWAYYNLVNPEVAILQSMIHAGRAVKLRGKGDNSSKLAMRESRYWLAHAITGMAMRAVVVSLVQAGIYNPSNDEDNTKKEREGEANYEPQGTVNITKLAAMLRGDDPNKVEGGLAVQDRWFGQWGTVGNAIARKYQDATPEQREKQDEFWNIVLGGLEIEGLKEMGNGVFSNTSALLSAFDTKGSFGWSQYGLNTIGMFTNIIHPATFAQMSRAEMNEATTNRANTFMGQVRNSMLARSSVLRKLTGQYPETKVGIWGDKIEKQGNIAQRLFGITPINKDAFARPLYNDAVRTGDIGFFPPAVQPKIGDTKLTQEQYNKFQEYVGKARRSYVAPFINDQANIIGFNVLYSQLSDDDKKYVLQYLYGLGSDEGKEKFFQDYPELKPKEEQVDYKKEIERELFKTLQKYQ